MSEPADEIRARSRNRAAESTRLRRASSFGMKAMSIAPAAMRRSIPVVAATTSSAGTPSAFVERGNEAANNAASPAASLAMKIGGGRRATLTRSLVGANAS